jgi:hypothetical protein
MMQMGFVEGLPPDLGCLENGQRLAFSPCENFQGPDGTDANSRTNKGKQRQYQGCETDTEQALISGSRHWFYWDLPLNHAVIAQISPSVHQWVCGEIERIAISCRNIIRRNPLKSRQISTSTK